MMIDFMDIIDRTRTGERIAESEYDQRVFKKSQEIAKELKIKVDPENPVPQDDALADKIYEAGMQFAVEIGGYCLDTGRVIKVTEEEIKEALKTLPDELTVGEGDDAAKIYARKPEDPRPPHIIGGLGTPVQEDMAITIAKAVALERIDSLVPFNLTTLAGRRLHGMPHEVLANRQQIAWSREAVRLAGKPGLHICNYPIATTAPAILAILHPDFIRKTDAVMISPLPEPFKINYDCLTAAIVAHEYGCFVWSDARSYIGGYAGGYESTLAVGCAAPLINITVLRAHYALWSAGFPLPEPKLQALDKVRWTYNMALQALKRNTRLLLANSSCTAAEPCTEQQLIEMASRVISHTASGASAFWAGRPVKPLRLNLVTPLEIRWVIEVSRAARKLNRRQANEISKALNVPEEKLRNPPTGKAFQECFDVTSLKPNKEYVDLYNRVKKKVEDLGLKFED